MRPTFPTCAMLVLVYGCADDRTASDVGSDGGDEAEPCPGERLESGLCFADPPRGTPPEECPSGQYGEAGICLPQPPEAPRLTSWACPDGWLSPLAWADDTYVEPFTYCEPPEPELDCAPGFMPLLGETTCVRQGVACPEDSWHTETRIRETASGFEGDILYVEVGASGSGTRSAPFGTLVEALDNARAGDILALAPGTYEETAVVTEPIAVLGACVEGTRLVAESDEPDAAVVDFGGAGGGLVRDLTVEGPRMGIRVAHDGPATRIEAVAVQAFTPYGLRIIGEAEISDVFVHDAPSGLGLWAYDAGDVTVRRSTFLRLNTVGIGLQRGSRSTFSDLIVAETTPDPNGEAGLGLFVAGGAEAVIERSLVVRNRYTGVAAQDEGTDLTVRDTVVADTLHTLRFPDQSGIGLSLIGEGIVTLERTALLRNASAGMVVADADAILQDVLIADTREGSLGELDGGGLVLANHRNFDRITTLRAQRFASVRNSFSGLWMTGDASAELADVLIGASQPIHNVLGELEYGTGIVCVGGLPVDITLRRAAVLQSTDEGIWLSGSGVRAEVEDLLLAETRSSLENLGVGLYVLNGPNLTLTRAAFLRNAAGVVVLDSSGESDIALADLHIAEQQVDLAEYLSFPAVWVGGSGTHFSLRRAELRQNDHVSLFLGGRSVSNLIDVIAVQTRHERSDSSGAGLVVRGATADVLRAAFVDNRFYSVSVQGGRALTEGQEVSEEYVGLLRMADVTIRNTERGSMTLASENASGDDPLEIVSGVGLSVSDGAELQVRRFRIETSETIGVQVGAVSRIDAEDGLITSNVIGTNIQQPDLDIEQAFRRVLNLGNEQDRVFTEVPIPDFSALVPDLPSRTEP